MSKLREMRVDQVSCILVLTHLYVEFHLSVVNLTSNSVYLRVSKLISFIYLQLRIKSSVLFKMRLRPQKVHIPL